MIKETYFSMQTRYPIPIPVLILFFVLLIACCAPAPVAAQQNVQVEQGLGFMALATPTLTLATTTPTLVGLLPAGTRNIYITAFNGDVLVGPSNVAGAGTAAVYVAATKIASGTTVKIDGIMTRRPNIYLVPASTSLPTPSIVVAITAWGEQ